MSKTLELIELAHGLLRDLPDCRLWGVDDGALVLGEDATHFVFCWHGALTIRQQGCWPHVLTAGMYAAAPGRDAAAAWRDGVAAAVAVGRCAGAGMDRCDARAEPDGGVQGDAGHHGADALAGCERVPPTSVCPRVR